MMAAFGEIKMKKLSRDMALYALMHNAKRFERFAARFHNRIKYNLSSGWLAWDGKKWRRNIEAAEALAKQFLLQADG